MRGASPEGVAFLARRECARVMAAGKRRKEAREEGQKPSCEATDMRSGKETAADAARGGRGGGLQGRWGERGLQGARSSRANEAWICTHGKQSLIRERINFRGRRDRVEENAEREG